MSGAESLVPVGVRQTYRDWQWTVAWKHVPELVTYRLEGPSNQVRFLKLMPTGRYPTLAAEAERMTWVGRFAPVPVVLDAGSDGQVEWLVTKGLSGRDGTHPSLLQNPAALVRALAAGLKRFHETPVADCPFDFKLDVALGWVGERLKRGAIDPDVDFHEEHRHLSARQAVALLHEIRPTAEDVVVCHGDYCPPNVLIDRGLVVGYLDLGEVGLADRWWDLAVATWSVTWNLGPGHEDAFLAAYGVDAQPERIRFYRLLYDLVS
ncbi:MAG: APH(3') family aminoglycoside O-phosphotransferase [Longimicrobiales bacterium]